MIITRSGRGSETLRNAAAHRYRVRLELLLVESAGSNISNHSGDVALAHILDQRFCLTLSLEGTLRLTGDDGDTKHERWGLSILWT
jgi:hypothetical protein